MANSIPSFLDVIRRDSPTEGTWQNYVANAGLSALSKKTDDLRTRVEEAAVASIEGVDYDSTISDAVLDAVMEAATEGLLLGYAMARTWPSGGIEELDNWLQRAAEFAGLEEREVQSVSDEPINAEPRSIH